ncbi:16S rRNA (guanine(966)-N(2))-methyltransferase RsmD [Haliangium ochraceum]|uniref:Methyltransferase n=1 Tax=Haliangium ochraceum (strain DSM 14365 / JCM 11303 / SMP-2) TaxID=502025 RepID=D0LU95_HALO1|nr:16S rRNA (guanine(966)-N(2))-methyltransferase RsmD [Haliangium ochraceum]ACY17459.1 methyltransferase [Haliangium ochraceum DSM 14365]
MRIIGGHLGGRRLLAPPGDGTRPTSDRVREALFNILGPPPAGARVLDVCAGSGGLGLEALSRGAEAVCFIERAPAALRALRNNIAALGVGGACTVVRGEACAIAGRWARAESAPAAFDWIFLDPPYRSDVSAQMLNILGASALLGDGGCAVVEHDRRLAPEDRYGELVRGDRRRYGDTELSFYQRERPAAG